MDAQATLFINKMNGCTLSNSTLTTEVTIYFKLCLNGRQVAWCLEVSKMAAKRRL
jgi:hypothetical protein